MTSIHFMKQFVFKTSQDRINTDESSCSHILIRKLFLQRFYYKYSLEKPEQMRLTAIFMTQVNITVLLYAPH